MFLHTESGGSAAKNHAATGKKEQVSHVLPFPAGFCSGSASAPDTVFIMSLSLLPVCQTKTS